MKYIFIALITVLLQSNISYSHGEEKPGPHGGHIRMPGAFHTEIVQEKNTFKIYLLDINWKNPTVDNSSVAVTLMSPKERVLKCTKDKEAFICQAPKDPKGELHVKASRNNQAGEKVIYKLPLKFEKESVNTAPMDHSKHH